VLLALEVHPHGAEKMVPAEALAVDVNRQNLDLISAPLLQLLDLLDAGSHGWPAHRTGDTSWYSRVEIPRIGAAILYGLKAALLRRAS
jgi:hypothetical protein